MVSGGGGKEFGTVKNQGIVHVAFLADLFVEKLWQLFGICIERVRMWGGGFPI